MRKRAEPDRPFPKPKFMTKRALREVLSRFGPVDRSSWADDANSFYSACWRQLAVIECEESRKRLGPND